MEPGVTRARARTRAHARTHTSMHHVPQLHADCCAGRGAPSPRPPSPALQHLLKDVRLFGAEASKAGLDTRLLEALQGVTHDAVARGLENTDYSAVYEAVLFPTGSGEAGKAAAASATSEAAA